MGPAWAVWGRKAGLLGLRGAGRGLVGTPRTQARGGGARGDPARVWSESPRPGAAR